MDRVKEGSGSTRRPASRAGAAYQGVTEAVLALLIATGIGFWLDGRLGTAPKLLLFGLLFGFGAFVLRLFRLRTLIEDETNRTTDRE
jgi:F0F1-type ATP synthase assembly protein I